MLLFLLWYQENLTRRELLPLKVRSNLFIIIVLARPIPKQDIVNSQAGVGISNPFSLDSEEDPDPSSENLEKLYEENAALEVAELVKSRAQLHNPRTSQRQIKGHDEVV